MSDDKNTVDYLKDLEQENDALQAKVRELEQLVKHYEDCDAHRQKEWQADLDRLHQVEQERDLWEHRAQEAEQAYFAYTDDLRVLANERDQLEQERNELQEYIAKQPDAEASITRLEQDNAALRAELAYSREREEMHSQLRQDNHQEMLRLGSETIALRERVKEAHSTIASFLLAAGRHDTSEPVSALLSKLNMWLRHAMEGR